MTSEPFIILVSATGSQETQKCGAVGPPWSSLSAIAPRNNLSGSVGSQYRACLAPSEKFAKRRATMAVSGLFFRAELRESLFNRRKVKHRVVSKAAAAPEMIEDPAFRHAAKRSQRLAVAGSGNHTNKPPGPLVREHTAEFA